MPLFWTDSIALCYSDVTAAKRWWMQSFGCKEVKVPADYWDCSLPSDVALQLPGYDVPTIALSDWNEVRNAGYERSKTTPFSSAGTWRKRGNTSNAKVRCQSRCSRAEAPSSSRSMTRKATSSRSVENPEPG